jgi:hypothetical protein
MEVTIIYNKSNNFGLRRDVEAIRTGIKIVGNEIKIKEADPLEPPSTCDIAIHLEVPIYGWMPWATVNVLMINPEWFECDAWRPYLTHFDGVIVRDTETAKRFEEWYGKSDLKVWTIFWADTSVPKFDLAEYSIDYEKNGFVWFLAGSKNKRAAAEAILPLWKPEYPPLNVYTTTELDISGSLAYNVKISVKDLLSKTRANLAASYQAHIVMSRAEGFGYTAAEGEQSGAFLLMNTLPAYMNAFPYSTESCAFITTDLSQNGLASYADFSKTDLTSQLDSAMERYASININKVRTLQRKNSQARREAFLGNFSTFWQDVKSILKTNPNVKSNMMPPLLRVEDCPPISIVTLLYNRRKFFDLACHNIMLSDYPKDKIEWLIVEDSDDPNESASDRVIQVGLNAAPLTLAYVPLERKTPISEKRNLGVKRAKNDIILFMDDDDHYPETSFRRRVAWLLKHPWKPKASVCTTIACYDLIRGVSAVNTPPWNLPLRKRISEATLTFYKSWWQTKKFTFGVNLSEGEGFLEGRENEVLEIPPQQIIVAFSHKKNISGRRIPAADAKPGCFWGFPKEFLIYIHKLAGIEVEDSSSSS